MYRSELICLRVKRMWNIKNLVNKRNVKYLINIFNSNMLNDNVLDVLGSVYS